ncbi:MAG TPA: MarR family winged helix-turn-helix transcriptional regulator [Burkholderiales bacterium]|jgi:DNA-binding MarR family transcriptional regulator|nr:MarR family winged helix-turn-helix transcriptional regulator [Burkholderiales bacterium]
MKNPQPKTPVADSPAPCNGAALRKAGRRLSQLYDEILAPSGLLLSQHSILVHIDRAKMPTMGDLARDMVLDRSALSHNLKPLERDGLVTLAIDKDDRRSRRITLTAAGRRKLAETKALWAQAQQRFETAYGVQKAAGLRKLLGEIYTDDFSAAFSAAL